MDMKLELVPLSVTDVVSFCRVGIASPFNVVKVTKG
jgi:hypothetical protein